MQANEIKQMRSPLLLSLFVRYLNGYFKKHFNAVRISYAEPLKIKNRPVIIYTNHPSWWDPLLFILLDKLLFEQRMSYGPMNQVALDNYAFMRRLGIFGMSSGSFKGLRDFIQTSTQLLQDRSTILWVTAQGQFSDPRLRPINLQSGVAHLVKQKPEVLLLPVAFEYPFWQERHPEILIRTGAIIDAQELQQKNYQQITQLLEQQLTKTMDELAVLSEFSKADQFQLLLSGEAGAGWFYNSFKLIKAKILGRKFHSKHSEITDDGNSINH